MRRFEAVLLLVALLGLPASASAIQIQSALTQPSPANPSASITVPAGTKIELVVTRPEWAQSAKDGDTVYAQTSFPTVAGNGMAIPAGTYVEGTIESVTRPTRKFDRAEIQVLFTKIVFANGYMLSCRAGQTRCSAGSRLREEPIASCRAGRNADRDHDSSRPRRTICCSTTAPRWR